MDKEENLFSDEFLKEIEENLKFKKSLEEKGIEILKILRCENCGKILPDFEEINEVRDYLKQNFVEYVEIYDSYCSKNCFEKGLSKLNIDLSKYDLVKELFKKFSEILNQNGKIVHIDSLNEILRGVKNE